MGSSVKPIILDGPMGTELERRGAPTPLPAWSASALASDPAMVRAIHRDYAEAGARVHTTVTFRAHRRNAGPDAGPLVERAVSIARSVAAEHLGHLVAGSIAPLEDCYRPDLSPPDPAPEHRWLARMLATAGCDLLLCETFPHVGEALVAVEEAVATGKPTWVAFTAGPTGELLTPQEVERGAIEAVRRGASAVLVNCLPIASTLAYVERLASAGALFGAYSNAGDADDAYGFTPDPRHQSADAADRYADVVETWVRAGATILGACCGLGPAHIAAIAKRFG